MTGSGGSVETFVLTLAVRYPTDPPPGVTVEQRRVVICSLETELDRIVSLKCVTGDKLQSSFERYQNGVDESEESYWFEFHDLSALERIAERIVQIVRRRGFRHSNRFLLSRTIFHANEDHTEYTRKIYPHRDTKWAKVRTMVRLKPRRKSRTKFPAKLAYLADLAGRCSVFPGYASEVLRNERDLKLFLGELTARDRDELVAIYRKIAARKDNEWFHRWLRNHEHEEWPVWVDDFHRLLALLERLRQGGLLSSVRGTLKQRVLKYWDDQLLGEP